MVGVVGGAGAVGGAPAEDGGSDFFEVGPLASTEQAARLFALTVQL